MNSFFQSIADANRAHCAALGLSAAELYGNPPTDPYVERMNANRLRMRKILVRQARECRMRRARYRDCYPPMPFERLARIERRIKGASK